MFNEVIHNYTIILTWTLLTTINLQSQASYDDKNNFNKSVHILEDGASGVQVGDIEQVIV